MPNETSLTGVWDGCYYQHNRAQPITAELTSGVDGRLTGSMSDGVTDRSSSVFEAAAEAGLAPGADEQIVAGLRKMLPDAPTDPITYVTHLPPESVLEGEVRGSRVDFVKSYQGTAFGGYRVGDRLVVREHENHSVHYTGTLSADGLRIEGRWWIEPDPAIGSLRTEGSFALRRRADGR